MEQYLRGKVVLDAWAVTIGTASKAGEYQLLFDVALQYNKSAAHIHVVRGPRCCAC